MKISLHNKLFLISISIEIILLSILYVIIYRNINLININIIRNDLASKVKILKNVINYKITRNEYLDYDDLVKNFIKDLDYRLTIVDIYGNVIADSEVSKDKLNYLDNHLLRPEVQMALYNGTGESQRFSKTINKTLFYYAERLDLNNKKFIIRVSIPVTDIYKRKLLFNELLIYSFLAIILLSIVIIYFSFFYISQPIKYIKDYANNITNGVSSPDLIITQNDEISELAEALNKLNYEIRNKINEVSNSKQQLEKILTNIPEGIIILDNNKNIIFMNNSIIKYLNLNVNNKNRKIYEIVKDYNIQVLIDKLIENNKEITNYELECHNGDVKYFIVNGVPIIHNDNTVDYILVFYDITKLKQVDKMRKDFVSNVSHELRTPLANIRGYTETILNYNIENKEELYNFVNIINNNAIRMSKIIDDLLTLSQLESGIIELKKTSVNLHSLVENLIKEFSVKANSKNITLINQVDSNFPEIVVDEFRIYQAISNLVDNAINYTSEKGKVIIKAEELEEHIKISVIDNGIGISKEHLERIFERFYRVDKSRSRESGGTGLGLSIVKHIVHLHKGEVMVESKVGVGSTFSFTIPKGLS